MTPEQVSNYLVTAVEVTRRTAMTRGVLLGAAAVLAGLGIAAVALDRNREAQQVATPAQQPGTTLYQDAFGRWVDEYGRIVG